MSVVRASPFVRAGQPALVSLSDRRPGARRLSRPSGGRDRNGRSRTYHRACACPGCRTAPLTIDRGGRLSIEGGKETTRCLRAREVSHACQNGMVPFSGGAGARGRAYYYGLGSRGRGLNGIIAGSGRDQYAAGPTADCAPPPTAIPVGQVFAPVIYDLVTTPTATLAVQPTRTAPAPPPIVTPVGQVFAPVVYDLVTTPIVTTPTATPAFQPTRTPVGLP